MKTKFNYIVIFFALVTQIAYAQGYVQRNTEIASKFPTNTYLGAILDSESLNMDAYKFINVPVDTIIISSTLPGTFSTKINKPSYNSMMDAIRKSDPRDDAFKGHISFSYNMKELNSYNELSLPFGQTINPATYFDLPEGQKTKKTFAIVNIQQVVFEIYMDEPSDGKLYMDIADLKPYNMDKLIYINTIKFGRKATLIVESDLDYADVKPAIEEMLNAESQPNMKSKSILANSIIRIMSLNGEEIVISNSDNPLENLLSYMYKKFTIQDFGTPISFGAAYLKSNGMFENRFTVE